MLRNQSTSPTPIHLRRRRQPQRPPQSATTQRSVNNLERGQESRGTALDLSIHQSANPSRNRFEVLDFPDLPTKSSREGREHHTPRHHRRVRNSRGRKETKRRRDVHRGGRTQAAQRLDERLSRDLDATLMGFSPFPQHVKSTPSTTPVAPATSILAPRRTHLPSTPPRLPPLDFSSFEINMLSDLARSLRMQTPPSTPHLTFSLPDWCPPLPSLVRNGMWSDDLPIFYDLSSLPEPRQITKPELPKCQDLQVWQGNLRLKPKQQSRFFPALPPPLKPTVKLPPTACRLHTLERGTQQCSASTPVIAAQETEPTSDTSARASDRGTSMALVYNASVLEPSAANLWHILTSENKVVSNDCHDPYLASFKPADGEDSAMAVFETPKPSQKQSSSAPELDGRELPYVHANCLTGYANEIAMSPYSDEHPALRDSAICVTPLPEPPLSLNELMVDHDVPSGVRADYPPPYSEMQPRVSQPSSGSRPSYVLADVLPIDCVELDGGAAALSTSDAHFQSELELFELPALPPDTPEQSIIDVAAFLKLGHAKNCWCGDCGEVPELIETHEREAMPLTEADDGWTIFSVVEDASSDASGTTQSDTEICGLEGNGAGMDCAIAGDWDEVFFDQPSPLWETVVMKSAGSDADVEFGSEWDFDSEF